MSIPKLWGGAIAALGRALAAPLLGRRAARARARAAEELTPVVSTSTSRGTVRLRCPSPEAVNHAAKFVRQEPETLAWIDAEVKAGDCLWDIGANIGVFSLYAALVPGVRVVAFEPGAASYAALNANILLNGAGERVEAYCLALSDAVRADAFHMTSVVAGGAMHSFGAKANVYGAFEPVFSQAALGFPADEAIRLFGLARPDHVKLDVDGNEAAILAGAPEAFTGVRTLMVEVDLEGRGADSAHQDALRRAIEAAGFALDEAHRARFPRAKNRLYRNRRFAQ